MNKRYIMIISWKEFQISLKFDLNESRGIYLPIRGTYSELSNNLKNPKIGAVLFRLQRSFYRQ